MIRLSYIKTTAEKTILFEYDKRILAVRFFPGVNQTWQVTVFLNDVPIHYVSRFGGSSTRTARSLAEQALKEYTQKQVI